MKMDVMNANQESQLGFYQKVKVKFWGATQRTLTS